MPTMNSHDMARRIPGSQLVIHKDAAHGGIFQYQGEFASEALDFHNDSNSQMRTVTLTNRTETMK